MLEFLRLFFHVLVGPFRTQAQLEAEITMPRHQLNVLRRQAPSRPRLTAADRWLFVVARWSALATTIDAWTRRKALPAAKQSAGSLQVQSSPFPRSRRQPLPTLRPADRDSGCRRSVDLAQRCNQLGDGSPS